MHLLRLSHKKLRKARSPQRTVVPSVKEPNGLDKLLQRLANFSQPALLVLGVFVYFYTVVPVFQHQQLQEQTAKLEIEKSAAERQLTSLIAQQDKVKDSIQRLQYEWEKERKRSSRLTDEVAIAKERESVARRQNDEVEIKLQDQLKVLDVARWELVLLDFSLAYYNQKFDAMAKRWNLNEEPNNKIGSFILSASKEWPKPYEELLSAVDAAAKKDEDRKDIPEIYYSELKEFITSKESALQCNKPDLDAIYAGYITEVAAIEPELDARLENYIKKVLSEHAEKKQRVQITSDNRSMWRRDIRMELLRGIDNEYQERLSSLKKECNDKAHRVIDEIRKAKGSTR